MLIPLLQHMFLQQISKRKISSYFMCLIRHFFVQIGDVDSKVFILFSHSFNYIASVEPITMEF
jgi:hypothetical protein